jgi:hypothetical protein
LGIENWELVAHLKYFKYKKLLYAKLKFQKSDRIEIALNSQMEREASEEIEFFEKKIKFKAITKQLPHLSSQQYEEMVEKKTILLKSLSGITIRIFSPSCRKGY